MLLEQQSVVKPQKFAGTRTEKHPKPESHLSRQWKL